MAGARHAHAQGPPGAAAAAIHTWPIATGMNQFTPQSAWILRWLKLTCQDTHPQAAHLQADGPLLALRHGHRQAQLRRHVRAGADVAAAGAGLCLLLYDAKHPADWIRAQVLQAIRKGGAWVKRGPNAQVTSLATTTSVTVSKSARLEVGTECCRRYG